MSYQVIARKYRPQRFADVVGQEHVTQTLSNAIQQRRIAHAYLFAGPRGTGKTTIARIFSMCLNCTDGPKVDFPADDPRCLEISEGRSMDVLEIDGASNRGIEEIRALRDTVKYAPANAKFKIYIIDEVHMLTKEAFNALLKTLEEPPEHVKFMFATTEPEKVLPTILSRCQRYDLRRIPVTRIARHLGFIAGQEGVQIDEEALLAIARGAEGCMRDAESTLDQLISFCGNRIVESDVLSMYGLTARGQIHTLAGLLLNGEAEAVLQAVQDLENNGKDLGRLFSDLLEHFRNLLWFLIGKGAASALELTEAETSMLKSQAAAVSLDSLTRVMEVLADGEGRLRDAVSRKIFIEVTLLKAIQARQAVSLDAVLQQLTQLRTGGGPGKPTAPAPPSVPPPVAEAPAVVPRAPRERAATPTSGPPAAEPPPAPPAAGVAHDRPLPAPTVAPAPPASGATDLGAIWARIVEAVGQVSQFTRTYLLQAHPVALTPTVLTIGYPPEHAEHIDLVDNAKNRSLIQAKVRELGLGEVQVKIVKSAAPAGLATAVPPTPAPPAVPGAPSPAPAAPPPVSSRPEPAAKPKPPVAPAPEPRKEPAAAKPEAKPQTVVLNKEDFKNDPLIKQALDIFKGQILEIRGPS